MFDSHNSYPTGIADWKTNKIYSATLASLVQLGAYNLCILDEDRQALRDECDNHFSEDRNNKIKVLGLCPAANLKEIKDLTKMNLHDVEQKESQLTLAITNPIYALSTNSKGIIEGYFEGK